jgi:hypothetical protein
MYKVAYACKWPLWIEEMRSWGIYMQQVGKIMRNHETICSVCFKCSIHISKQGLLWSRLCFCIVICIFTNEALVSNNSETSPKHHPCSVTIIFGKDCVLGHCSVMQPLFRDHCFPQPVIMPGLYHTPTNQTISQWEFSSLALGSLVPWRTMQTTYLRLSPPCAFLKPTDR